MNMIESHKPKQSPFQAQAAFFKALTHPVRLAILYLLRDGEHCVCHLEAHLGCRQAYISQQLAVLREIGLVQDRRDGWNVFYRISNPEIYPLLDASRSLTGTAADLQLEPLVPCPCPSCKDKREVPIIKNSQYHKE